MAHSSALGGSGGEYAAGLPRVSEMAPPSPSVGREYSPSGGEERLKPPLRTVRVMYEGEVRVMGLEDYVRGVVPREMPASWPAAALEAQAVVARSYAVAMLGRHGGEGYDLCATEHCQVWRPGGHPRSDAAVESTQGIVGWRGAALAPSQGTGSAPLPWGHSSGLGRGEEERLKPPLRTVAATYYSASCGGSTLDSWGPGWLRARTDCPCRLIGRPVRGHRQGLCQWGAMWLASVGLEWQDIVGFYYELEWEPLTPGPSPVGPQ